MKVHELIEALQRVGQEKKVLACTHVDGFEEYFDKLIRVDEHEDVAYLDFDLS